MPTVKELRALAKDYGLPGRSKLKKDGLIWAIAEARAAELIKRVQRAQKTGRLSAIRGDVGNPHKKGRRRRELAQIDDEVDAALRAGKYVANVERNPRLRLKPLKKLTGRALKPPHLRGLVRSTKETLARALVREGPEILDGQLDPEAYYALYDRDAPVLYPDGGYVRTGKRVQSKAQVLDEIREIDPLGQEDQKTLDERFDLRPVERGPDITDEGAVYWVSFENEDFRVTENMATEATELLDLDERYKLFTVVGKAAKEPLAPVTEEEGASEHRITGRLIVRGDEVTAGALRGIDIEMWENGREYLVFVRYELRPLPEQQGDPGPMLAPEADAEFVNCFVRYVVNHFQNKMTRAGSGLTPKRQRILERFDRQLADTGCTREDMFSLEAALKVKLVAVDALGGTLWDSGKYNTHTKVVVVCHNNHAWADLPTDPPKIKHVHTLDDCAEKALSAVNNEKRTTAAAQKAIDREVREILVAFAARAIPSTVRLWLCGQALVGSDGSLWRSLAAFAAIDRAFEEETGGDPRYDLPEELEIEFQKAVHSMGGASLR